MDISLDFVPVATEMANDPSQPGSASPARDGSGSSTRDSDQPAESSSSGTRFACNPCRERKIRCDRRKPKCGRCAKTETSCNYSSPSKQAMSKSELSRMLITLHDRLENAEAQLSSQANVHRFSQWPETFPRPQVVLPTPQTTPSNQVPDMTMPPRATDWSNRVPNESSDILFGGLDTSITTDLSLMNSATGVVGFDPMLEDLSNSLFSDDDIDITSRLSLALLSKLHAAFFDMFHPAIPIVNRVRFQNDLDRASPPEHVQALSYAIATLGALVNPQYSYALETCYNHARNLLDRCERQENGAVLININTLQTYILLCLYELKKPNFARAWMTLGRAIRLAKIMCLDKADDCSTNITHNKLFLLPPPVSDPTDMEERRRTFWLLYILDGCAAMRTNSPSAFNSHKIFVQLPCHGELQDIKVFHDVPALQKVFELSCKEDLSLFARTVVTIALYRHCSHHIESSLQEPLYPFWDNYYSSEKLIMHYRKNMLDLHLEPGTCDFSVPLNMALRLNLAAVELSLHQAAIVKARKDNLSRTPAAEASARCRSIAKEILDTAQEAQRLIGREYDIFHQIGLFLAWAITKAIQAYLWMVESDKSELQTHIRAVRFLYKSLSELVGPENIQPGLSDHMEAKVREAERPSKRKHTRSGSGSRTDWEAELD